MVKVEQMNFEYLFPKPIKCGQLIINGLILSAKLPTGFKYDLENFNKESDELLNRIGQE